MVEGKGVGRKGEGGRGEREGGEGEGRKGHGGTEDKRRKVKGRNREWWKKRGQELSEESTMEKKNGRKKINAGRQEEVRNRKDERKTSEEKED